MMKIPLKTLTILVFLLLIKNSYAKNYWDKSIDEYESFFMYLSHITDDGYGHIESKNCNQSRKNLKKKVKNLNRTGKLAYKKKLRDALKSFKNEEGHLNILSEYGSTSSSCKKRTTPDKFIESCQYQGHASEFLIAGCKCLGLENGKLPEGEGYTSSKALEEFGLKITEKPHHEVSCFCTYFFVC